MVPKIKLVAGAVGCVQGVVATPVTFKLSMLILGREPLPVFPLPL